MCRSYGSAFGFVISFQFVQNGRVAELLKSAACLCAFWSKLVFFDQMRFASEPYLGLENPKLKTVKRFLKH